MSKRKYQPDIEADDNGDEVAEFSDGDGEYEEDVNSFYRDYNVLMMILKMMKISIMIAVHIK